MNEFKLGKKTVKKNRKPNPEVVNISRQARRWRGPRWATAQGPPKFGAPKLLCISSVCTNIITLCHLIQRQGLSKVRSNKKPAREAFLSVPIDR